MFNVTAGNLHVTLIANDCVHYFAQDPEQQKKKRENAILDVSRLHCAAGLFCQIDTFPRAAALQ